MSARWWYMQQRSRQRSVTIKAVAFLAKCFLTEILRYGGKVWPEHVEGLHVKSKGLKSNVLLASKIFGLIWDNRIVVYHMGIDIKLWYDRQHWYETVMLKSLLDRGKQRGERTSWKGGASLAYSLNPFWRHGHFQFLKNLKIYITYTITFQTW